MIKKTIGAVAAALLISIVGCASEATDDVAPSVEQPAIATLDKGDKQLDESNASPPAELVDYVTKADKKLASEPGKPLQVSEKEYAAMSSNRGLGFDGCIIIFGHYICCDSAPNGVCTYGPVIVIHVP